MIVRRRRTQRCRAQAEAVTAYFSSEHLLCHLCTTVQVKKIEMGIENRDLGCVRSVAGREDAVNRSNL